MHPHGAYMRRWTGSALIQIMAVACSAPSHYLNQCWLIIIWTLRNNRQWNSNRNTKLFIHENAFEYITSAKWWPFCPGRDELIWENIPCYNGTILWLIYGIVKFTKNICVSYHVEGQYAGKGRINYFWYVDISCLRATLTGWLARIPKTHKTIQTWSSIHTANCRLGIRTGMENTLFHHYDGRALSGKAGLQYPPLHEQVHTPDNNRWDTPPL